MTVGLSSLDKPLEAILALECQYLWGVLTGSSDDGLVPPDAVVSCMLVTLDTQTGSW